MRRESGITTPKKEHQDHQCNYHISSVHANSMYTSAYVLISTHKTPHSALHNTEMEALPYSLIDIGVIDCLPPHIRYHTLTNLTSNSPLPIHPQIHSNPHHLPLSTFFPTTSLFDP